MDPPGKKATAAETGRRDTRETVGDFLCRTSRGDGRVVCQCQRSRFPGMVLETVCDFQRWQGGKAGEGLSGQQLFQQGVPALLLGRQAYTCWGRNVVGRVVLLQR